VITTETAQSLLFQHYGITGAFTPLDGDEDKNFRVKTGEGQQYTFKIMHDACAQEAVALPCAVLQHLQTLAVNIPRVIPTLSGKPFDSVMVDGGSDTRFIWLLSWCSGTLLAEHSPHTQAIYHSFGRTLATIDKALQGLQHPAMRRHNRWQLTHALDSAYKVDDIQGESQEIVRGIFNRFGSTVLPKLHSLPHRIIHNDANDYNVVVTTEAGEALVNGLFDFGDSCWQPLICDVAIALAYLIHRKDDPLAVCASFLAGYCTVQALSQAELAVLLELINTRLAVTVAISSHRQKCEPDNKYIVYSQQPSKDALITLAGIDATVAQRVFHNACAITPETGAVTR
jgi:Ser/Thr protein kinase RdoA (MazF antagonist)